MKADVLYFLVSQRRTRNMERVWVLFLGRHSGPEMASGAIPSETALGEGNIYPAPWKGSLF